MIWVPAKIDNFVLGPKAKTAAKRATGQQATPERHSYQARSTIARLAVAKHRQNKLPNEVGKYSKRVDNALPGKHTRALYDTPNRKEANVLVQLRTGMSRLNSSLHKIGAVESDLCDCGQAPETMERFLFRCRKWTSERDILMLCARTRIGNLSHFLGGKTGHDPKNWTSTRHEGSQGSDQIRTRHRKARQRAETAVEMMMQTSQH
ncbi:hypothetical protein CDD83_10201 [Cordyceps sp. RAO-2017]|nr:hypothetical protein CDD83_10201 [Cordyceps sp. RAO-2017]